MVKGQLKCPLLLCALCAFLWLQSAMRLNQFPRMLLAEWRRLKLPFSGETIIVAVSGGADSTALLLGLEELKTVNKLTVDICVAHLDHRLRQSSAKDAKWVE